MTTQVKTTDDLLSYLVSQAGSGQKNWFGFAQQRLTGIALAHDIAKNHADKLTPEQAVDYAIKLNNTIILKQNRFY
jgi:hypothetical protein